VHAKTPDNVFEPIDGLHVSYCLYFHLSGSARAMMMGGVEWSVAAEKKRASSDWKSWQPVYCILHYAARRETTRVQQDFVSPSRYDVMASGRTLMSSDAFDIFDLFKSGLAWSREELGKPSAHFPSFYDPGLFHRRNRLQTCYAGIFHDTHHIFCSLCI
jgi:hypothetical protein